MELTPIKVPGKNNRDQRRSVRRANRDNVGHFLQNIAATNLSLFPL